MSSEGGPEPFAFKNCPPSNDPGGEGGIVINTKVRYTGIGSRSIITARIYRALLPQQQAIYFTGLGDTYIP